MPPIWLTPILVYGTWRFLRDFRYIVTELLDWLDTMPVDRKPAAGHVAICSACREYWAKQVL